MAGFWCVVPNYVLVDKTINNDEFRLYLYISRDLNTFRWCPTSNKEFARRFDVDERTISRWLSSLQNKKFIRIIQNNHKHRRQIYLTMPTSKMGDYEDPPERYDEKQKKFAEAFPERLIDCEVGANIDMDELIKWMKNSDWLMEAKNMSLSSCLKRYEAIIAGGYDKIKTNDKSFALERKNTKEECNSHFQNIDEIEI